MKKILVLILPFILYMGCSPADEIEIPKHIKHLNNLTVYSPAVEVDTLLLEREINYGSKDDVLIGRMGDIVIDKMGRVFIADRNQNTIYAFQPDGSYLTSMGRNGNGPGEFQEIRDIKANSKQLFAFDRELQRINIYSLESLESSGQIGLNPQNWSEVEGLMGANPTWNFHPVSGSKLLMGFNKMYAPDDRVIFYYFIDKTGKVISDKILEQQDVSMFVIRGNPGYSFPLPFSRKSLLSVSTKGHIYSAWTDVFLIEVYDFEGNYLRAFYYPYANSALNRDEIINSYPEGPLRQGVRQAVFLETWPALNSMQIDDENRLWVSTILDDQEVYQWWVLDEQGKLLTRFNWPRDRRIEEIKGGYLYARETEEKTGIQKIVKYRIEMY